MSKKGKNTNQAMEMKGGDQAKKKEAQDKCKEVEKIMKKDHVSKGEYAMCIQTLTDAITLL